MASSSISGYPSSFEVIGEDGPDGINIDEVLETAVEEAENQDDFNEESRDYRLGQCLEKIPPNLYDLFQTFKAGRFQS